ncbi:MAG: TIGR00159 family protein [Deltaproteobacteria bacterium]|nr:TIGR00159 family protein [Deltaproteobacteria bacterium]
MIAGTTWLDAVVGLVDILIVYYLLYRVLLLIRGTRAAHMLIGLVLIGAGFFAARQFELATVSWLLDNFINYFIILIIVVFQHDIRRGLVRIGQNLFSFGRTYEETHVFDEVIRAALHLSRARMGALIVFEREGDVTEFVETGEAVDARVSKELLVSLFVPSRDNELHDGAVIIRHLRIHQAGAVLPLSKNPRLDKALGTRHRAAIGITEETDAVALVVSEERGEMSLCFHGNVARDLDTSTLRKALLGLFYREKRKGHSVAEQASAAAAAAEAFAAMAQAAQAAGTEPQEEGSPASRPDAPGERAGAEAAVRHPSAEEGA